MNRILSCLVLLCLPIAARAQITASFIPSSHYLAAFSGGGFGVAGQTFTSTLTGQLSDVSFLADALGPIGGITVEFRTVSGNLPAAVLGTATIDTTGAGFSTLLTADFNSQNIALTAGTSYAIDFLAPNVFGLEGADDAYAGGQQVTSSDDVTFVAFPPPRDLYFSVAVAPSAVPEPSTYGVIGVLVLLAAAVVRRRAGR